MKICLVTAFPPSRGGLSEYGFHIARELQRIPFLSVTVLADELPSAQPELEDFSVVRCWSFDDPSSPGRLLKTIRTLRPDVVWFNLIFTTFGHHPLVAFYGLSLPLLTRISGCYSHVTLHHLMENINLNDAAVRFPRLYRMAGMAATKMLLMSNSVSVLMPAYRSVLHDRYRGDNVFLRPHGIFESLPEYPDLLRRGAPDHQVLAFGKWGTYKRLELLLDAFPAVAASVPNVKLVIAGGDHPRTPGYIAALARRYAADPRITFTGYVAEEKVADLFKAASVAVMPYSSSTGSSGIAHLACAYGVPIVSADIPDFREMAQQEGMAIGFYELGNRTALAQQLTQLLKSEDQQRAMALQNFSAALRMTMPRIVRQYVRHFELTRGAKTLRPVMRMRKLPRWLPASFLGNAMARSLRAWAYRPGLAPSFVAEQVSPGAAHGVAGDSPAVPDHGNQTHRSTKGLAPIEATPEDRQETPRGESLQRDS